MYESDQISNSKQTWVILWVLVGPLSSRAQRLSPIGCTISSQRKLSPFMYSQGPTPREIVISLLCLVSVLYLSASAPSHHVLTPVSAPSHDDQPVPFSALKNVEQQAPKHWETHLSWDSSNVPATRLVAHVPGWTVFDRLYVFKGVMYIISDDPGSLPALDAMISNGEWILPGREAEIARLPSNNDMKVISSREAKELFGGSAQIMDGVSVSGADFAMRFII
jgi:hypothetical protein